MGAFYFLSYWNFKWHRFPRYVSNDSLIYPAQGEVLRIVELSNLSGVIVPLPLPSVYHLSPTRLGSCLASKLAISPRANSLKTLCWKQIKKNIIKFNIGLKKIYSEKYQLYFLSKWLFYQQRQNSEKNCKIFSSY